jgi:hypothetical protein
MLFNKKHFINFQSVADKEKGLMLIFAKPLILLNAWGRNRTHTMLGTEGF